MRNKLMNSNADTEDAVTDGLAQIYAKTKSWRLTGLAIKSSGSYARLLVLGKRRPTKNILAAWQEWTTQGQSRHVDLLACPTCNGTHNLEQIPDCRGREVIAVVTLGPHERVARQRGAPAPHTLSDYPTLLLKRLIEERKPMGVKL